MLSFKLCIYAIAACLLGSVVGQSTSVSGTLEDGPTSQGSCNAAGSGSFLCSNGAYCTWSASSSNFSCVGGSGTVEELTGPPGRECTSHVDHWDCTGADGEESTCELSDGVWVCESFGTHGEGEASGSTCVIHGGHTHGDCSGNCNSIDLGEYDLDLHIVSLFVVMVGSLLGVTLPIFSAKSLSKPLIKWTFFVGKHFGTGVILSTVFIHLLYHSFVMFGNACLGELAFEPAASAIALAGLFFVFLSDFAMMRYLRARSLRTKSTHLTSDTKSGSTLKNAEPVLSHGHGHGFVHGHAHGAEHGLAHGAMKDTDPTSPQAHFDVLLLEAGIIFHSIMIGVSLGASGGTQWQPLFIAVVFHQFFEGLALGSRIALLQFPSTRAWRKWAMALAFGFITPVGIAIGMGVHSSYNPNSGAALLSIGILDAVSAGVLLYAGVVELLVHDFILGELATAGGAKVTVALGAVMAGMIGMSVLGKWA